jgi:hypothetical protein
MANGKGAGMVLAGAMLAIVLVNTGDDTSQDTTPAQSQGATGSGQVVATTFASRVAASQAAARQGDIAGAARALGMTAGPSGKRHNVNCAAFATGQVRQYLLRTPCRSMDRLLFTIRDARGGTIAVAVAWVDFPSAAQAEQFRLIDAKPGTGQINPLPGSVAGIPNVHLTGRHHRSDRVGTTAVSGDAEPVVAGQQSDGLLDAIAGIAVLLPYQFGQAGK